MVTNIIDDSDITKNIFCRGIFEPGPSICCRLIAVFGTGKCVLMQAELAFGFADLDKTSYITSTHHVQATN